MLEVLEGGIQTTVQDWPGRTGYLDLGMFPAGPMDSFAFRVANLLVGNSQGAAALEITAGSFKVAFTDQRVVALTGADMRPTLNDQEVPRWESFGVHAGDVLALSILRGPGLRAYLSVRGAITVPDYLGSKATFTVGRVGGFQGRNLKKGDRIPLGPAQDTDPYVGRRLKAAALPRYETEWEVEAVRGPQADPDYLTTEDMAFFFSNLWRVDRNSNRMGIRLDSHRWQWARTGGGIAGGHPSNILDNGYALWTVNVCGDQPIILVADGPSLGGFISCATIGYASRWKIGQLAPGRDRVRFREISVSDAVRLARATDEVISEASVERI